MSRSSTKSPLVVGCFFFESLGPCYQCVCLSVCLSVYVLKNNKNAERGEVLVDMVLSCGS